MSVEWLSVIITLFIIGSIWMFLGLHFRRKRDAVEREPLVSNEVRAASHEVSNEATKLRAVTRTISDSDDPLAALVSAMTGQRYERHH